MSCHVVTLLLLALGSCSKAHRASMCLLCVCVLPMWGCAEINVAKIIYFISLLWRCWLGGRKGIRPVKTVSNKCIAVRKVATPLRELTCHTVLPATRQRWHSRPYLSRSWYSIKWPRRGARLSWPSGRVLAWLSVWRKVQTSCGPADAAATHCACVRVCSC